MIEATKSVGKIEIIMMDNQSSSCCRKKYRLSCVRSKGAILVLLLCLSFYTIASIFSPEVLKPFRPRNDLTEFFDISFGVLSALCILYPLLGLVGEYWKRYNVVMIGAVILSVNTIILIVIVSVFIFKCRILLYLTPIVVPFYFISLCLFEANIIQFGADQLHFEPSEQLSSFVHWLSWVRAVSFFSISLMATAFLKREPSVHKPGYGYGMVVGAIIVAAIGVYLVFPFRRHLVIDPAQRNNPVKLIWRVMRYACSHKQPVRRSAFTYGEPPPSRLDFGKQRYGGPFTTVQVEDVKSFCYIIFIIFASFGFSIQESIYNLYNVPISVPLNSSDSDVVIDGVVRNFPALLTYFVAAVAIPIHQLLIVPYFSFCILGILKRIWIGLVLVLIQLAIFSAIVTHATDSFDNHIMYGLIGLQVLAGMSNMLVFIGILEFILAQAPRTMQGILIGLWLMQYYFFHYMDVLTSYYCNRHSKVYIYYIVKAVLVSISVIIFTFAAYKYKYRQRNELSDVNERVIIAEYTERQLDREEQLDRDESNSRYTSFYIMSEVY